MIHAYQYIRNVVNSFRCTDLMGIGCYLESNKINISTYGLSRTSKIYGIKHKVTMEFVQKNNFYPFSHTNGIKV